MSQDEVFEFLKRNKGRFFTCSEIAGILKINPASTMNSINSLEKRKCIIIERITGINNQNVKRVMFGEKDKFLEEALCDFFYMKNDKRYNFLNSSDIMSLMIVKELKKLNGDRNGNEEQV